MSTAPNAAQQWRMLRAAPWSQTETLRSPNGPRTHDRHCLHRAVVRRCKGRRQACQRSVHSGTLPVQSVCQQAMCCDTTGGRATLLPSPSRPSPALASLPGPHAPVTAVGQAANTTQWSGGRPSLMAAERKRCAIVSMSSSAAWRCGSAKKDMAFQRKGGQNACSMCMCSACVSGERMRLQDSCKCTHSSAMRLRTQPAAMHAASILMGSSAPLLHAA